MIEIISLLLITVLYLVAGNAVALYGEIGEAIDDVQERWGRILLRFIVLFNWPMVIMVLILGIFATGVADTAKRYFD